MTSPGDFRGVGWAFPVQVAPRADSPPVSGAEALPQPDPPPQPPGAIALSVADQAVRESILLILGTARGERVMRPAFGCGIHELVFGSNDPTTAARISHEIREALIDWEPRAEVLTVDVGADPRDDTRLLISLQYRVRSSNNAYNLVYPFYLETGP